MTGSEYAAARKKLGMSQSEWARELCVSRATIVRVEAMDIVPVLHEKAMQVTMNNPVKSKRMEVAE